MIINNIKQCGHKKFFRSIVYILIVAFSLTASGCYTTHVGNINPQSLETGVSYTMIKAIMKDGTILDLRGKEATFALKYQDQTNVILFTTTDTTRINANVYNTSSNVSFLQIKDIQSLIIEKEEMNTGMTILTVVLIAAAFAAVIALIISASKETPKTYSNTTSCPFIYSYNGQKYIFDGEPYGGAITEGLKKTDYSRLDYLKPEDGKYKLLIRNQSDETQHTDEMKLLVIEHPENTEAAPDINGNISVFEKAYPPLSVTDENGKDITVFFNNKDNVQWQTDLPSDTNVSFDKNLKHELILKFPKPKNAEKVKFLVNAGTDQLGEDMIRVMLDLRGDKVDKWYESMNSRGSEFIKLYTFMEREELYMLKANVLVNNQWITKSIIPAGGPYIDEDRIVELNIADVTGDTLYIKLTPPFGYWKFDYAGVIYESTNAAKITELSVSSATDENGYDVKDSLNKSDGRYYSMPELTNFAKIEFDVPASDKQMKQTLFLKTTGYYELHLKKDKPEQTELIEKIYNTPGMILEISLNEYSKKIKSLGLLDK